MSSPDQVGLSAKILLVEDHPDMAEVLGMMLQKLGHSCVIANSVADGLAAARREPFDVIMSDFRLPDGNANDLVGMLSRESAVRAILLTAFDPQDIPASHRQGFICCLPKSAGPKLLGQAIEAAMCQPAKNLPRQTPAPLTP